MGASFVWIETSLEGFDVRGLSCVEVGTEHRKRGDGSTKFLHEYCLSHGLEFYTVDADPVVAANGKTLTPNAIHARGEDFLATFPGKPIVFAYLDNFDWAYSGNETVPKVIKQAEHYRAVHGTERTHENSQLAHLKQARALLSHLHTTAFVLFDDTWRSLSGFDGKGGTAVPFLLENGFAIVNEDATCVLLRRG